MESIFETKTLSVTINRDIDIVYRFISSPKNLPLWAKAFCKSVRKFRTNWIIGTPAGSMKVRFAVKNSFGVLDHYIYPSPKIEIYVPMRVLPNGAASEVMFTLFRRPDMSRAEYLRDIGMVTRDLKSLKKHLEKGNRK